MICDCFLIKHTLFIIWDISYFLIHKSLLFKFLLVCIDPNNVNLHLCGGIYVMHENILCYYLVF